MASIYAECAQRYKKQASAEALFFHSSRYKGLRVFLPDLSLEFTDGSFIGTDAPGQFYYNDLDLVKTANKYVSDNPENPADNNQLVARVKLYKDDTVVAEFLGDDKFGVVKVAGMVGYGTSGHWQHSSADSYADAHLNKEADSSSVTLDISHALKMKATMTTVNSELKTASILNIKGRFHYDSLDDVSNGTHVSYTNDRLVFYNNSDVTTKGFTGYFIPDGSRGRPLLGISDKTELEMSETVWEITK
ncbi:hypothetical protein GGX14DRAFT_651109 [Mycena pura]|uniref:Uncharacterized protein n=1 Tax=Mycena pura TaxID=153505 RepID=A0AAD6YNI2_9AGAR|nr:hypothetical protein GGX14DRAFT_651109 [Mycena pura]